ncbi:beta-glucosidase [Novosphingobium sp.]|uniref:beta-glucosidase n=1 Tax=Novosphingobium sp. TaxID=1874826 RepID=UPI0025CE5C22|nr:beta-glucosidase [Novosphingobium sp.]
MPGIPRLGIPYLAESDASLGVANLGAVMRAGDVATAFPSGAAMASTWDAGLIERAGAAMGAEAKAKGFNVLLAGGMNLVREPRNGRNFEYLGEDPLLAGTLGGHAIRGVQSNGIVSTIKHYALNAQETGRTVVSSNLGEAAMRESDLLAFEIGIEIGRPGSVMCAYNRVNGVYACENQFLLNRVLRGDWGWRGWVMSDWGAVHSTASLRAGLDQESGTSAMDPQYFGQKLRDALADGRLSVTDVDRAVLRILRTMNALGVTTDPVKAKAEIDYSKGGDVAQAIAEQGIVLLRNRENLLPVAASSQRILVVGGHADKGVLQGGGSSQVNPVGGAALALAMPGEPIYHRRLYSPSAPLAALRQLLPAATVTYDDGTDPARAAAAAHSADIAIVFAEQSTAEGADVSDLALPDRQDALIEAVASANPRNVVVLETGGPVTMPWLDKAGAVLAAWYPGQRGGLAIARLLTGAVNPSGRLPITFPRNLAQTPNPRLPGSTLVKGQDGQDIYDLFKDQPPFDAAYPEGADMGYRWYDRTRAHPLFAFGHGLNYTRFTFGTLTLQGGRNVVASFVVTNSGQRAGIATPQVYAVIGGVRRLIGWARVDLAPGASQRVRITAEPRILAGYDVHAGGWTIKSGRYRIEVSEAADAPLLSGPIRLNDRHIAP